jgi:hypothetical protein
MSSKKKKKSKAEKRFERQRRNSRKEFSVFNENAVREDFRKIVETIWDEILNDADKDFEDLTLHSHICEFCALGWNILSAEQSVEEAKRFVAERVVPEFDLKAAIPEIINVAIELKNEYCPEH